MISVSVYVQWNWEQESHTGGNTVSRPLVRKTTCITDADHVLCECIPYRPECPRCGVCPTSSLPCWPRPAHSPAARPFSSPTALRPDRTRTRTPLTLKVTMPDAYGEPG